MNYNPVKAGLNLHAVLKNLEDIVEFDREMNELTSSWDVSVKFIVRGGPCATVRFSGGKCTVEPGSSGKASIILWFLSPAHLNRMFDGAANPVPLKGFTKLGFLSKEFPKLTDRLSYYLKPDDELIKNKSYLEMNTRLTLNTAAFAVPEILTGDPVGKKISSIECSVCSSGPFGNSRPSFGRISARSANSPGMSSPCSICSLIRFKVSVRPFAERFRRIKAGAYSTMGFAEARIFFASSESL